MPAVVHSATAAQSVSGSGAGRSGGGCDRYTVQQYSWHRQPPHSPVHSTAASTPHSHTTSHVRGRAGRATSRPPRPPPGLHHTSPATSLILWLMISVEQKLGGRAARRSVSPLRLAGRLDKSAE